MPQSQHQPLHAGPRRRERGPVWALAILIAVAIAVIVAPIGWFLLLVLQSPSRSAGAGMVPDPVLAATPWALFATSVAWAAGVALVATAVVWPIAWFCRGRPMVIMACMIPLAMPNYLAYAALNLARAPNTILGDAIQNLAAGESGWTQAPMLAGRLIAGLGLVLWVWPLCLLALVPSIRNVSDDLLDQLDLELPSAWARLRTRLRLCRDGLIAAALLAVVVILGSPVPLHVAQVPTASMAVWVGLVQDPGNPRHWLTGWPLLLVAAVAAAGLAQWLIWAPTHTEPAARASRVRENRLWRTLPLAASVLIPLALLTSSLHEWASIPRFLKLGAEPLIASLLVGAVVAGICLALGCLLWFAAGPQQSRWSWRVALVQALLAAFAAAALCPGVMVGAAVARAASSWLGPMIADSPMPLIAAHVARYGAVAMTVCMLLRRAEPRELSDALSLDGATGVRGFWVGRVWPSRMALAAAGLLTLSLSVHDIDTSIMVQPPGSQSLAERMLGYLHFAKTQELSAGSIVFEVLGLVAGCLVLLLSARAGQLGRGRSGHGVLTR